MFVTSTAKVLAPGVEKLIMLLLNHRNGASIPISVEENIGVVLGSLLFTRARERIAAPTAPRPPAPILPTQWRGAGGEVQLCLPRARERAGPQWPRPLSCSQFHIVRNGLAIAAAVAAAAVVAARAAITTAAPVTATVTTAAAAAAAAILGLRFFH